MAEIQIGCSGFLYDQWRGTFYPRTLSKRHWLEFYSNHFLTVELNVTFYRLPDRETFAKWYAATPENFIFSLKGSRFITHTKKLKDCMEPLEAFFSRASVLKEKLGAVLWQLPPNFGIDVERLEEFLDALKPYEARNTFEFRNKTWIIKKTAHLLEKHGAAFCMADDPDFLKKLPLTSDFIYIRRHGRNRSDSACYSTDELKKDAKFIKTHLRKKMDVFVYFNNDISGYAPKNAEELLYLIRKKK